MKTFLLYLLCFFVIFSYCSFSYVYALSLEEELVYGLIKENAVLLDTAFEPITSLPKTYFAVINSEISDYYYVTYLDLFGFIEKDYIEVVDYEPKTKFHSAYYLAKNDTFPTNIRRTPQIESEVIFSIPNSEKAFLYGSQKGDEFYENGTDLWYFVKYSSFSGYVFSLHGVAESIPENVIERVEKDTEEPTKQSKEFDIKWFYILLVTLPAVVIMFALFSRSPLDRGSGLEQGRGKRA